MNNGKSTLHIYAISERLQPVSGLWQEYMLNCLLVNLDDSYALAEDQLPTGNNL